MRTIVVTIVLLAMMSSCGDGNSQGTSTEQTVESHKPDPAPELGSKMMAKITILENGTVGVLKLSVPAYIMIEANDTVWVRPINHQFYGLDSSQNGMKAIVNHKTVMDL